MGCNRELGRDKLKIVLDTNMLLLLADGVNIFEQIEEKLATKPEYIVLKPVYMELKKLAENPLKKIGRKARFVLSIIDKYCKIVDVESSKPVDDLIVDYAVENHAAVASNDRELREKLRARGIPEIYLREEKMMIEVEGLEHV